MPMVTAGIPNPEIVSRFRAKPGSPRAEHTGLIYRQRRGIFDDIFEDLTSVGGEIIATIISVA